MMEALNHAVQPFLGWLLETTVVAGILVCLILAFQKLFGGRLGPRWTHALWLVLLVRMVLPWTPSVPVHWAGLIPARSSLEPILVPAERPDPDHIDSMTHSPAPAPAPEAPPAEPVRLAGAPAPSEPWEPVATAKPARPWLPDAIAGIRRLVPVLWLAGVIVLGGWLFASNFALWRTVKRERPLVQEPILELFERCKSQMGVETIVALVPSDRVRTAALFGFLRPRLLLPRELIETAGDEELRYIFLHELGHLKRHDIYIGWLAGLLQVLHWFNPLIWLAFHRMRSDRELACDALVLTRTGAEESHDYGRTMVGLLGRFSRARSLPAMAGIFENKTQLKRRITMIAEFNRDRYRWSPTAVILMALLAAAPLPSTVGSTEPSVSRPPSEPSISLRRVKTGSHSDISSPPSLDGRYLCDVEIDAQSGVTRLIIRDLVTGEIRPLTEGSKDVFSWFPFISPDNERVAYVCLLGTAENLVYELHLIRMDGTEHEVLHRFEEGEWFTIRTWTSDSRQIIGTCRKGDGSGVSRLVALSVEDGTMEVLHTRETPRHPDWPVISPDGRYIAYERASEKGASTTEIYILDIASQATERVVRHRSTNRLLGWTPDGNHLFFTSDRRQGLRGGFTVADTWDAYLLPVANGKRQGPPQLVKRDMPRNIRPKGFTRDGAYFYTLEFTAILPVVAQLDVHGGTLTQPEAVGYTGADQLPIWSPDGRYLAYTTHHRDESRKTEKMAITIRSLEDGDEQLFDLNLPHFESLHWSPDGQFLVASAFETGSSAAIYKIDVGTGVATALYMQDDAPRMRFWDAQLSPDGQMLFYVCFYGNAEKRSVIVQDMDSGHKETLFSRSDLLRCAISPDGRTLAVAAADRVLVMSSEGGEATEVLKGQERNLRRVTWTPDGQFVLVSDGQTLWLASADGERSRKICDAEGMRPPEMTWGTLTFGLDVHPDGKRIAYDWWEYRHEVWVMENFLP